ncbi:MAG TPA: hypothetical protein VIP11_04815 [Gemmatimonadaceae bacterium]
MTEVTLFDLIYLVVAVGAFVGYWFAFRHPDRTRLQVIALSAAGAGLPTAILCAILAAGGQNSIDLLPWTLIALGYGAFIGVAGIVARIVGAWLSRRQS